jgi:hypothetical protein
VPHFSLLLREAGFRRESHSGFRRQPKMQTAPEFPEPFARTDKSAPCQGNITIIDKIQQEIK